MFLYVVHVLYFLFLVCIPCNPLTVTMAIDLLIRDPLETEFDVAIDKVLGSENINKVLEWNQGNYT